MEAAIGGTAEATIVKSAPGIIGVRRRADCSHGDQDAEKTKREPHLFPFAPLSAEQRPIVNRVRCHRVQSFHAPVLLSRALLERSVATGGLSGVT